MKPALITGANGWLGTELIRTILEGIHDDPRFPGWPDRELRGLVLPGSDRTWIPDLPNVSVVEGDLTRPETLAPFFDDAEGATVFHTAGVIHPPGRRSVFYEINLAGTQAALEAALTAGVRRFVHVSSNSPFGTNPGPEHVFDERSKYRPYMHYGRSKMLGEQAVFEAGERGIEVVVIRPPWFYGPNQPARQTLFFSMIRDGKFPAVGDGSNRRSMAYTENICQGAFLAESTPQAAGKGYWIADAEPYPMQTIVQTVREVLRDDFGFTVRESRLRLPGLVGDVATALDAAIQGVGLYHQKIHVLSELNKNIACSIDTAREELGYDPKISLREGMRRSIGWVVEQGLL